MVLAHCKFSGKSISSFSVIFEGFDRIVIHFSKTRNLKRFSGKNSKSKFSVRDICVFFVSSSTVKFVDSLGAPVKLDPFGLFYKPRVQRIWDTYFFAPNRFNYFSQISRLCETLKTNYNY